MKTDDDIIEKIKSLAQRNFGVSRREVRDTFRPGVRDRAMRLLDALMLTGEIEEYLRGSKQKRRRLFTVRGCGQAWSAGAVQPQQKAKPQKPPQPAVKRSHAVQRLDPSAPVAGTTPTPQVLAAGVDHRYTVRELPQGYRSALNPRECRPWANVAATARAAA